MRKHDKRIGIEIALPARLGRGALVLLLLAGLVSTLESENRVLSTYHPSPSGAFQDLTVWGRGVSNPFDTYLAPDAGESVSVGFSALGSSTERLKVSGTVVAHKGGSTGHLYNTESAVPTDNTSVRPGLFAAGSGAGITVRGDASNSWTWYSTGGLTRLARNGTTVFEMTSAGKINNFCYEQTYGASGTSSCTSGYTVVGITRTNGYMFTEMPSACDGTTGTNRVSNCRMLCCKFATSPW